MRKLPTEVKEAQGTLKKSRILEDEVSFSLCDGVPDPPNSLDNYGEAVWNSSATELEQRRLLFKTDLPALETYCTAASFCRMAAKEINKGDEGSLKTRMNNWFRIWKDSASVMDKYGAKFGFSPVDKTNIAIPSMPNKHSLFK